MQTAINLWPLLGVLVIVVGFVLRFNPMLVVAAAAVVTGLAASMPLETILATIGTGFIKTRTLALIILLPLPSSACWSVTACGCMPSSSFRAFAAPRQGAC